MLITILAIGTSGDTLPYLALGSELQKAPARVRIACFKEFEEKVKERGFEFFPIRGDIKAAASSSIGQEAMNADNPIKLMFSFSKLKNLVYSAQKELFEACKGSDIVVYHPGCTIGHFAAREFGIPSVLASPFPMTPTRDYPSLIFYDFPRLGGTFNWLTHKIFEQIMWATSESPVKTFFKQEFGRAPKNFSSPFSQQKTEKNPAIVSCSKYVFPTPGDYPDHVYHTGYWIPKDEPHWDPPVALLDFLDAGQPPVYVGFGSLGNQEAAKQTAEVVLEALEICGQRGVLATGWSGLENLGSSSKNVFFLESAPHTWLFLRMSLVVHHGGAGTTAAGLAAGVPGVIVPFSNDQFAWGRRIYELGAGAKPIPRKKLTAKKLATAIQFALSTKIGERASQLGTQIRAENGTEQAAKIILNTVSKDQG